VNGTAQRLAVAEEGKQALPDMQRARPLHTYVRTCFIWNAT